MHTAHEHITIVSLPLTSEDVAQVCVSLSLLADVRLASRYSGGISSCTASDTSDTHTHT